jgi:hypothetical protein
MRKTFMSIQSGKVSDLEDMRRYANAEPWHPGTRRRR